MGPSHTAAIERGSPIATNDGRANADRLSQHFAMTSGPIPAGSPRDTASGGSGVDDISRRRSWLWPLTEFDHRVAAQIAQVALGARIDPLVVELVVDLVVARRAGGRLVAAANDQDADS